MILSKPRALSGPGLSRTVSFRARNCRSISSLILPDVTSLPSPVTTSLPIDPRLARSLQELRKRALHQDPQDWVFANKGGQPREQQNILHRHVRPAALRAGIGKIGWHTFRHSYSTMLRGAGADIKVQQELLRHSTIQSTLNTYTQAISEQKRSANSVVVGILLNENASTEQPPANGS